jgi:hypothetical protein
MFRKVTWLGIGLAVGFGASKWVERRVRQQLQRLLPANQLKAGVEMAGRARGLAAGKLADLRNAVEGGRSAMAAREVELRRQLHLAENDRTDAGGGAADGGGPSGEGGPQNNGQGAGRGSRGRGAA